MCQKPYKPMCGSVKPSLAMGRPLQEFRPSPKPSALRLPPTYGGGFSLLELILVLAIVATLAAIAIPRYQGSLARYRADLAARRIVADLALAQSNAKAASSSRSVVFSVSANNYQMPDLPPLDGTTGGYIVELRGLPYEADLISADFGGDQQVIFSGWGIPDSGGSVILSVGAEQRTVIVDAESGKAEVQ